MIETIGWIAFALGMIGKLVIGDKHRAGWLFFLTANIAWTVTGLILGFWALSASSLAYAVMDYRGWRKWHVNNIDSPCKDYIHHIPEDEDFEVPLI